MRKLVRDRMPEIIRAKGEEEIEQIRSTKAAERGAFAERVIWSDK